MEGKEESGMRYVVIVRWMLHDAVWKTLRFEFDDFESAEAKAKDYYDHADVKHGEEITCLIYELKKSFN